MKTHASFCWASLISTTTAVVCIGIPLGLMAGDTTPVATTTPAATVGAPAPAMPYGVAEVVKMYQDGIGKDILIGYIENSSLPFHLNADGIIYLQHLGMPQEVTSALLRRDGELQKQAGAVYQQQQQQAAMVAANPQPAPGNAGQPLVMPSSPPPVVPYAYAPEAAAPMVYPDYAYPYAYPYYGYPYFYGPNVIIGGGFGWGWGGRGFGHGGFGHGGFGHGGFGGRGGFGHH